LIDTTMATVHEWLAGLGLGQYADIFAANDIDLEVARLLDDGDLEKLGLSLGHRRLFLKAAATLPSADPTGSRAATARDAVPASGAGRRQLTVMFCDLANSTGLSAKLDPEDMQKVISTYQRACATVIEQAHGYVAKYMGDGVLAYFGYPRARADAAERAVHAGLGIVQAVARSAADVPLAVRVGIATGEVVVGEQIGIESSREWAIVGDTPNLAARLQVAARPGQVLVAELTHRLTERRFVWGQSQRLMLKGFDAPTPAWEALAESTLSGPPQPLGVREANL
jgi:class 3 adenylate cyclase